MVNARTATGIPTVLVVEDEESFIEALQVGLKREGFRVEVARDGLQALEMFDLVQPDLVLLDVMLPKMSGIDVCRQLRQANNQTPILVVSARDSETDRVLGLEVGADDYLVKPFGMRELVARARALLRRSSTLAPPIQVLSHGILRLYPEECRVTRDGKEINLSPKEYRLLELFMQNPRRVWSRDKLLEHIWGHDYFGDSKTVDVHIRWLREKLEENPSDPIFLQTVRGFGYRFG
jgi:two-component system phosphate regulon response regulator PhoB